MKQIYLILIQQFIHRKLKIINSFQKKNTTNHDKIILRQDFKKNISIINNFLKLINKFLICVITCLIQDFQNYSNNNNIKTDKKSYQEFNF